LPENLQLSLGIALYAMFIGLLVPGIKRNLRLFLLVVMTAALNTVLSIFLSGAESLIISTLICAFAGVFFVDLDAEKREEEEVANEN
jgi:predicted branched-subunit amino acid permease